MELFFFGYPGDMGGANTEAWHTIQLWRNYGIEVNVIPTWGRDPVWRAKLNNIGCNTIQADPKKLESIPGLAGAVTVGMCNCEYLRVAPKLRQLGCKIIWVNCMTFMFDYEIEFFKQHGPAEAMVYQSEFQRKELESLLVDCNYQPSSGHLIRGAFDLSEWPFSPRPHGLQEEFFIGRAARPDLDKWSSNTFSIYERIQVQHKRGMLLGVNNKTREKLGNPPWWIDCLRPLAIPVSEFYARLHCMLPINGGARENWSRAGLEAMAAGVPIVAQNEWGWPEMITHGVNGFLGSCDEELAHWAAVLAYDEPLRLQLAKNARRRLEQEFVDPQTLWKAWKNLFRSVGQQLSDVDVTPRSQNYDQTATELAEVIPAQPN